VELAALQALDATALQHFAEAVDTRLQKAELIARSGDAEGGEGERA
jgi:hypothetical protein